jgi:hypothetical protein
MIPVTIRLGLFSALILAIAGGDSPAQQPATVAEAAKGIDLETFPLLPGGVSKTPRRLANLGYAARGDAREAFAFQKKTLEERGWKELPGGYASDQSCSGTFGKDGFTVSVMTSSGSGPDAAGLVDIRLMNHGNVDLSKLPVPPEWKPLYSFPTVTAYVSEKAVKDASAAINKLLTADGWQPYGHAGDSLRFKKNAIRLSAWPSRAPAQGGKTMIQLSTELMSVELPAPPVLLDAAYADVTKTLSLEVDMSPAALAAFYRAALAKAGWRSTTEKLVKIDFDELMIFRNEALDIATLKVHTFEGKLRATLQQQTAAEFDETVRLAKAEDAKLKADSARYAMKAAQKAANDRGTVAITVPATATDLKWRKDEIEFKLAAGTASLAVDAIRTDLMKDDWKGNTKPLDPTAGSVIVTKPHGKSLAILYIDTGQETAKISISATGTDLKEPKAK